MIGGIEAIESDEQKREWLARGRCGLWEERTKEAWEKSVFVLQLNLVVDREARF